MSCDVCAASGRDRPAAARCRYCSIGVCSEHLTEALRAGRTVPGAGCGHVFIAVGWLASAIARPTAAVAARA
jgi:hypothetical protein